MPPQNRQDYSGKVVLLTGAGSGFGRLAALRFSERGAKLALCDIDEAALQSLEGELDADPKDVLFSKCDVSDSEDTQSFFDHTLEHFHRIDVAVNNAGIAHDHMPLADCDESLWARTIAVNLTGVFLCMTRELSQMAAQGGGIVLNIASVAGVLGAPMLGPYCASKHGVVGLTKTAAAEYGPQGIRVNALCPGYSQTPLVEAMIEASDEDMSGKMTGRIPLGRMAKPEEIVDAMLWVCSEQNGFMNGASVVLDGGLTAC
jgi:NAD(P)-dependent dehydrogenase (short-subunit alcohol dehydrogenase family)